MGTYEIQEQYRHEQATATADATLSVAEIGPWLASMYDLVAQTIAAQGSAVAGTPFARYRMIGDGRFAVEAGFPVAIPIEPDAQVHPSSLPGGPAASTIHIGPYDDMEPAYRALVEWIQAHDCELAGDAWEIYYSDPEAYPDPATWRTEIVQPYRHVREAGEQV